MMNEMRFTAASKNSPLTDVVMKALEETGGWSVSAMRAPGFRALEKVESEFRALAPLMDKAQVVIDRAVLEVGLQRLTVAADIMSAGLTYPLSDPLSVTQLEWSSTNKIGAAQRTMTPSARGENKLPIVVPNRLPVYLTTDGFELDIRTLKQSQRVGQPLDTTIVGQCTRSVNEAIEDATINGATTLDGQDLKVMGYGAPGLLNAPNAELTTHTLADWTTLPNGGAVFADVEEMITKLQGNKKFGPYHLYVGTTAGNGLDFDYNATNNAQGLTIRARLMQIEAVKKIAVADMMPSNKIVLVQMTKDVVDMVVGQPPTVIPWTSLDGFTIHNLVMAIMIPRVRSDYNGDSGICIGTLS
jgi:hypothetical protein